MIKEELDKLKISLPTKKEIFENETQKIYFNNSTGSKSDFVEDMCLNKQNIWLASDIQKNVFKVDCVRGYTLMGYAEFELDEQCSVRPILELNGIDVLPYANPGTGFLNGLLEVELGEYPQSIAPPSIQYDLYMHKGVLTDKKYSIQIENENKSGLNIVQVEEYEYKGKKYVRIPKKYKYMPYTWYEVEPIKWIVDLKNNKLICKDTIIVGTSYNNWDEYSKYLMNDIIYNTKQYMDLSGPIKYR